MRSICVDMGSAVALAMAPVAAEDLPKVIKYNYYFILILTF